MRIFVVLFILLALSSGKVIAQNLESIGKEKPFSVLLTSDPTTLFDSTDFSRREIEATALGLKRSDGTAVEALSKKYNYSYNSSTKPYEKIT